MILIISNNRDKSTFEVSEWLLYSKSKYIILKETDEINDFFLEIINNKSTSYSFKINNNQEINSNQISSIWIRLDGLHIKMPSLVENSQIKKNLNEEWLTIKSFILNNNKNRKSLGYYPENEINKLKVLKIAAEVGLDIPRTIICTSKNLIKNHIGSTRLISKHISNLITIEKEDKVYSFSTFEIKTNKLPDTFFPSLFQNLIEKKYELRIFFFQNKLYPMAIFSQLDKKTEIDFRNYNYHKPNRTTPFKLPKSILEKLKKLIKKLGLDTGSIDMIVTPNNNFFFLEVNPHGQFGFVSSSCNYFIEKDISEYLRT